MGQRNTAALNASSYNLGFKLCPRCGRAIPASSDEKHCINDGEILLTTCPVCATTIMHPYAKHCSSCGYEFALVPRKQND
jgi:ribosomal protein L37E